MSLVVIKRDGGKTPFNAERIEIAVAKAADAVGVRDEAFCRRKKSRFY